MLTLLPELYYGRFHTITSAAKHLARETVRSVWETKWIMRAELFLREKDQWHDSAAHVECIFEEMLRSVEHAGMRERDHQCRCWENNEHSPPRAPTTSHATAFEQLISGNNHQLVKSLADEVYHGCLIIGSAGSWPANWGVCRMR